ncbi:hypothetical protein XENTR_v10018014 [Xenopus tropicalis]|nr:hypothetical protein XENTR_v10018014 [Xenopus tropicalis]
MSTRTYPYHGPWHSLLPVEQVTGLAKSSQTLLDRLMPSQERIPVFPECAKQYHMDLNLTPAEEKSELNKPFVTQVHLSLHYFLRKKDYYFGLKESKPGSPAAQLQHRENENAHFNKMTDGNETEEEKHLFSLQPVIPQPNSFHGKQSMANHNSVSTNRAFTALPIKLEIQAVLEKSIDRPNFNSNHKKQCHAGRKGFSSITITAKKKTPPLNHTEIKTAPDPIVSLCRSNNMVFQGSESSSELDQQPQDKCRHLFLSASRHGTFHSCLQTSSSTNCQACICSKENNADHLSTSNGDQDRVPFISSIYNTTNEVSPSVISYVDKSLALCLGKIKTSCQNIHKSEMSFKINPHRPSEKDTTNKVGIDLCRPITLDDRTTVFDLENKNTSSAQRQPDILGNYLETESPARSEYLFQGKEATTDCSKLNLKLKHDTKYQLDQPKRLSREPLKNRSCSARIKESHQQVLTPKSDPQLHRGCLSEGYSNLLEGSRKTTFNFIFGKQTAKSEKEKQISHKENIAPNGSNSWEKTERDCIEDLPLPLPTTIFQQEKPKKNKENEAGEMSLREALEHHRPDFISNSQERVHKLELMARRRKLKQVQVPRKSHRSPLSKLPPKVTPCRRKLFTVPLPLSDNLFKPTERVISEKEMQQRSKRIYNSLPEVKKKKEDEEKKMIILSNRLRAELFKKKLLNQVLQRNAA